MSCEAIYKFFFTVMEKLDTTDGQLFIKVSISGTNSSSSESVAEYRYLLFGLLTMTL